MVIVPRHAPFLAALALCAACGSAPSSTTEDLAASTDGGIYSKLGLAPSPDLAGSDLAPMPDLPPSADLGSDAGKMSDLGLGMDAGDDGFGVQ